MHVGGESQSQRIDLSLNLGHGPGGGARLENSHMTGEKFTGI